MRSDSSTPPGSRSSSTGRVARRARPAAPPRASTCPAPSMPSIVMSRPRTAATLPFRRRTSPRDAPRPRDAARHRAPSPRPRRARRRAARRAARRATPTCSTAPRAAASARWRARSPPALLAEGAADPAGAAARVERGAHPDLTWVAPASAAGMLVGDIDEAVVAGAARTPFESRRRVFVIEDADELNDQAANRMLKTLEEPPSFAHLILLTSRPGEVLPTIASRCQPVRFDAPTRRGDRRAAGAPRRRARRRATPVRGSVSATPRARWRWRSATGRRCARAPRRSRAARCATRSPSGRGRRCSTAPAPRARSAGEAIERALDDELGFAITKDHARLRREAAERGKRAARRAQTAALDRGLALVGLWLRDVACVADGAPELAHHSDRLAALREDAALGAGRRPRCAPRRASSRRRAPRCSSTPTRSSRSTRWGRGWRARCAPDRRSRGRRADRWTFFWVVGVLSSATPSFPRRRRRSPRCHRREPLTAAGSRSTTRRLAAARPASPR